MLAFLIHRSFTINFICRPLHTALINEKYEVFQNLLDVMATLPDAKKRINAFNHNYQVGSSDLLFHA